MAILIIDQLELVDIEKQHRQQAMEASGLFECELETVKQHPPVRQAGQTVEKSQLPGMKLGILDFGDIAVVRPYPQHTTAIPHRNPPAMR